MIIKFKKLNKDAKIPTIAYADDAGIDLYADETVTIYTDNVKIIKTGIAVEIPPKHVGFIKERSGLSIKYGYNILAGVIDAGYRGEIGVVVKNTDMSPLKITKGTKIAQLVILSKPIVTLREVNNLSESERGQKGFGSSNNI
jgi:dUTP pyrophosphatase